MVSEYSIKNIAKKDTAIWDAFVSSTSQGNIFSKSVWLKAVASLKDNSHYRLLGCYVGDELVGGCGLYIVRTRSGNIVACPPLTPYNGVLIVPKQSEQKYKNEFRTIDISTAIASYLESTFDYSTLLNSPALIDVRSFKWRGWNAVPSYTYNLDINKFPGIYQNMMGRSVMKKINKAKKTKIKIQKSDKIRDFLKLYRMTFEKQDRGLPLPEKSVLKLFNILHKAGYCQLYVAKSANGKILSGNIQVSDNPDESFDWLAGSNPKYLNTGANQLLYWSIFEDLAKKGVKRFDFCGADIPSVARHKSGFGGDLTTYYVVSKACSYRTKLKDSLLHLRRNIW